METLRRCFYVCVHNMSSVNVTAHLQGHLWLANCVTGIHTLEHISCPRLFLLLGLFGLNPNLLANYFFLDQKVKICVKMGPGMASFSYVWKWFSRSCPRGDISVFSASSPL